MLNSDNYGEETSWTLETSAGTQILSNTNYDNNLQFDEAYCVPDGEELTFTIDDSANDGVCCGYGQGSYQLYYKGQLVKEGGDLRSTEVTTFGESVPPTTTAAPPTTTTAATTTTTVATTTTTTTTSTQVPPSSPCGNEVEITIELLTDDYGGETYWKLEKTSSGVILGSSGQHTSNTLYSFTICAPQGGQLKFTITDSAYDGICCGHGLGYYKIYKNGSFVYEGGGFYWRERITFS